MPQWPGTKQIDSKFLLVCHAQQFFLLTHSMAMTVKMNEMNVALGIMFNMEKLTPHAEHDTAAA